MSTNILINSQLIAPGAHGVHGKPVLQPVVVEHKRETGQSTSQPCLMALIVREMIPTPKTAILMVAQVM